VEITAVISHNMLHHDARGFLVRFDELRSFKGDYSQHQKPLHGVLKEYACF